MKSKQPKHSWLPDAPPRLERSREHLDKGEVDKLLSAAKNKPRNAERDYCLLLLMVRHGFRAAEVCDLKRHDVNLSAKTLFVKRSKNGDSGTHPLYNGEPKAIKEWLAVRDTMGSSSPTLFISDRRLPLNRVEVFRIVRSVAKLAGLEHLNVHPHMLRHACGYDLANKGVDTRGIQLYLGHRNIQNTTIYTALSPKRFANYY
jgi:type 1 fimbriae regulatory protein FimB